MDELADLSLISLFNLSHRIPQSTSLKFLHFKLKSLHRKLITKVSLFKKLQYPEKNDLFDCASVDSVTS